MLRATFYTAMHVVLSVMYPFAYICLWILSYYVHPHVVPFAYASRGVATNVYLRKMSEKPEKM